MYSFVNAICAFCHHRGHKLWYMSCPVMYLEGGCCIHRYIVFLLHFQTKLQNVINHQCLVTNCVLFFNLNIFYPFLCYRGWRSVSSLSRRFILAVRSWKRWTRLFHLILVSLCRKMSKTDVQVNLSLFNIFLLLEVHTITANYSVFMVMCFVVFLLQTPHVKHCIKLLTQRRGDW